MYCHGARLVVKRWLHGSSNMLSNMILNGPVFTSCKLIHGILYQSHFCPIFAQTKSWKPQQSIRTFCTQWCKGLHVLVSSDGAARTRLLEAQLWLHSTWQYVAWGKNEKKKILSSRFDIYLNKPKMQKPPNKKIDFMTLKGFHWVWPKTKKSTLSKPIQ